MLERFFVRPTTVDRIRGSWLGKPIERYVSWLAEHGYAERSVLSRVPILLQFGEFAWVHGARTVADLPAQIDRFVAHWLARQDDRRHTGPTRLGLRKEIRGPVEQFLRVVLTGFTGRRRSHRKMAAPFADVVPGFFAHLREERGLRGTSIDHYRHHLRAFESYLQSIHLEDLDSLSAVVLSSFVTQTSQGIGKTSVRDRCGVLRVFLRYLHREGRLPRDLSGTVEAPQVRRLSGIPRSVSWDEVRRMLDAVDRRTIVGRRDYAMLLLLVTYGLRAREVAALTLDDIDWRSERLRVPERKAGHSTAFPLSPIVGAAIVDYLQRGRPTTSDRHIFFRVVAPRTPVTFNVVGCQAARYLHKAGVVVPRPGSHTLRHTCVQRLVDAGLSLKVIGDYIGHRQPSSTQIYSKVDIETLREVACGPGEEVL
ncbi:MAG: site-specific integrase [Planctomycetota bacterium]|jgi:site-specific recombinase XerD